MPDKMRAPMEASRSEVEATLATIDAKITALAVTPLSGAKMPEGVKTLAKKGQTSGRLEEPDVETLRALLQQRADLFEQLSKDPLPQTTLKRFKPEFRLKK